MDDSERRRALADFLRKCRARLAPGDVGLPPGLRRRTPGLRREEVAQLANIGASWYVWLEQGRDVRPSAQVLECIARALRLTPNERRHLFVLGGLFPPPTIAEEVASPALQQILDDLGPSPAYAIGRRWDFLAWNAAADALFTITEAPLPYGRNLVWRFFTDPVLRGHFVDWEQLARGFLAEFRTASARYPGDRWFGALIEDLCQASPEFREWWPALHAAPRLFDGHKVIEHAALGHLEFDPLTMQLLNFPDLMVTVYTPDAATRAKLQELYAHRGRVSAPGSS